MWIHWILYVWVCVYLFCMCSFLYLQLIYCIENAKIVVDYLFFRNTFFPAMPHTFFNSFFAHLFYITHWTHVSACMCASTFIRSFIHYSDCCCVALCYTVAQLVVENFHFVSLNTVPFNTHRLQQYNAHTYSLIHSRAKFYSIIFCYLFFLLGFFSFKNVLRSVFGIFFCSLLLPRLIAATSTTI